MGAGFRLENGCGLKAVRGSNPLLSAALRGTAARPGDRRKADQSAYRRGVRHLTHASVV